MAETRHISFDQVLRVALALGPSEREGFLLALAERDPELHARIAQQLRAPSVDDGQHSAERLPQRIGPYVILRRMGSGDLGVVYEAQEGHPKRKVALKVIHPWLCTTSALELIRYEAKTLARLDHPAFPAIYEVEESAGTLYIAMELVKGRPIIEATAPLRQRARVRVLAEVARAVDAAHQLGIMHGDIRSSNVLLTADRRPKLLNFGLAAQLTHTLPLSRSSMAFASPERLERRPVTPASDLYALGVLSYQVITGFQPFDTDGLAAAEAAQVKRAQRPPSDFTPYNLPPDVAWLVDRCLEPSPIARPSSAAALAHDLDAALDYQPLHGRGGPTYQTALWTRRNRGQLQLVAGIASVLILAAGLAASFNLHNERHRQLDAFRHLEAAESQIDALFEAGEVQQAAAVFDGFVTFPQHQGTAALSAAWRHQGHRLRQAGDPGAAAHLAAAWTTATDERSTNLAGRALARELLRRGHTDAAWRVLHALPPEERPDDVLLHAAVARGELPEAIPLADPTSRRALEHLQRASSLGLRSVGLRVLPLVDGKPTLVTIERDHYLSVRTLDARKTLGTLRHPDRIRLHSDQLAVFDDALWLAAAGSVNGPPPQLFRAPSAHLDAWQPVADLHAGNPMRLRVADLGFGPQALVAMAYPARTLRAVDLQQGRPWQPHPAGDRLDSDVMDVAVADLDLDGQDEVVVTHSNWSAYDVQVLNLSASGATTRAHHRVGATSGVAIVPRPGQRPLVAVAKVNDYPNPRVFGRDEPYGPPPGIYLYELRDESLREVGFIPDVVSDDTDYFGRSMAPITGDIDGDGHADLIYGYESVKHPKARTLVVVPHVARPHRQPLAIEGLLLQDVADGDGDGDDEIWVSSASGEIWMLGAGSVQAALPTHAEPIEPVIALDAPTGSSGDLLWSRAAWLSSLGLHGLAADALELLAGAHPHPATQRRAYQTSAQLREANGDSLGAANAWQAALRRATPDTREELAAGTANALVRRLQINDAAAIYADSPMPSDLAWLGPVAATEPVDFLGDAPLDPRWDVLHPEALSKTEQGWMIDTFNDHGTLMESIVELTGDRVALEMDLDVGTGELGSGLAVEITTMDDTPVLHAHLSVEGGGGTNTVRLSCLGARTTEVDIIERQPSPPAQPLRLHLEWLEHVGVRGCHEAVRNTTSSGAISDAVPRGPHILRITSAGHASYAPPTYLQATVRRLTGTGMRWPDAVPAAAVRRARFAMATGRMGHELTPLRQDPALWVHIAARDGDEAGVRDAVNALLREKDYATLRRALRLEGIAPHIAARAPRHLLTALLVDAFQSPMRDQSWREDLQAVARWPEMDLIRPDSPEHAAFMTYRAKALTQANDYPRARRVARQVLQSPLHTQVGRYRESLAEAHLLLAELDSHVDEDAAVGHLTAYLSLSPSPEVGANTVRMTPELADLLPRVQH